MIFKPSKIGPLLIAALAVGAGSPTVQAGGLLDLHFGDVPISNGTIIDNPYWPLRPDNSYIPRVFTYIAESDDECVIDQVRVDDPGYGSTHLLSGAAPYGGVTAVQVVDIEWVFEDVEVCDTSLLPNDAAVKEFTLDWYLQDDQQNIWYVGELSQSFEEESCGSYPNPLVDPVNNPECFGGSWEAGVAKGDGDEAVVGEAGIVVPGDFPTAGEPLETGAYFFQEIAFEAEDMAKILRQHASLSVEDGIAPGEYEQCRKTKEWNPLESGSTVEHKWYCRDGAGLVLVEGNAGGPTEYEVLVDVNPVLP